jgi:hypothetical protein
LRSMKKKWCLGIIPFEERELVLYVKKLVSTQKKSKSFVY